MSASGRTAWIVGRAHASGFDLCGVATLDTDVFSSSKSPEGSIGERFEEIRRLPEWLARGYAGEMKYLYDSRRANPRAVLPGARSLIVAAMNYNAPAPQSSQMSRSASDESPRGWISRYAWGDDYHETILPKLNALISDMRKQFNEPFEARAYVDTGPIVERVAAKYAGLGWLAKNTCLINQKLGSWLFLGVIVTTLDLEPSVAPCEAPPADLCGSCTRCLDACPTHAFPEPYVLDARRCISYLTIELRGPIPEELRGSMGNAAIGCDICQDVCPWNRKAPSTRLAAFQPREFKRGEVDIGIRTEAESSQPSASDAPKSLMASGLEWLASLSQQQFSAIFRQSAVKRARWRGLVRNACVALGNSGISKSSAHFARILRLLEHLSASGDSLISSHSRWAFDRLSSTASPNHETRPR